MNKEKITKIAKKIISSHVTDGTYYFAYNYNGKTLVLFQYLYLVGKVEDIANELNVASIELKNFCKQINVTPKSDCYIEGIGRSGYAITVLIDNDDGLVNILKSNGVKESKSKSF